MSIGHLMQQKRQALGITVAEAAHGICAVTAWYAWEQGPRIPRVRYDWGIYKRLQISVNDLPFLSDANVSRKSSVRSVRAPVIVARTQQDYSD